MDNQPKATPAQQHTRLQDRVVLLEEAVDLSIGDNSRAEKLLRGRVKRLEEAIGEIYDAQAGMEKSLREMALARLTIKRALSEVSNDLANLSEHE